MGCAKRRGFGLRNSAAASKIKMMISTARFAISKHTLSFIIDIGTENLFPQLLLPLLLRLSKSPRPPFRLIYVYAYRLLEDPKGHTLKAHIIGNLLSYLLVSLLICFISLDLYVCDAHAPCSIIALFSHELVIYLRYYL